MINGRNVIVKEQVCGVREMFLDEPMFRASPWANVFRNMFNELSSFYFSHICILVCIL